MRLRDHMLQEISCFPGIFVDLLRHLGGFDSRWPLPSSHRKDREIDTYLTTENDGNMLSEVHYSHDKIYIWQLLESETSCGVEATLSYFLFSHFYNLLQVRIIVFFPKNQQWSSMLTFLISSFISLSQKKSLLFLFFSNTLWLFLAWTPSSLSVRLVQQGELSEPQAKNCLGQDSKDLGLVLKHFGRLLTGKLEWLIGEMAKGC